MFEFLQSLHLPTWLNSDNVLAVLLAVTGVVESLKALAKLTATKADDELLARVGEFLHDALRWVPTIEIGGPTVEDKQIVKEVKDESKTVQAIAEAKVLNLKVQK